MTNDFAPTFTTEDLSDLIKQYNEAYAKVGAMIKSLDDLQKPAPISHGVSLEEATLYAKAVAEYKDEEKRRKDMHKAALAKANEVEGQLRKLILVSNVWIKAGDYGVCTYGDAWGGWHSVLWVKAWKDPMPSCEDKTYYP